MKKIYRYFIGALLLLLLSFGLMPKQISADIVGTDAGMPTINVFADVTWTVITTMPLTSSDFTIAGATSVTWNSDNLFFYAIVKVSGPTDSRLVTVNPATGVCTNIGSMGGSFSSLTYSSTTGTLYAMGGNGGGAVAERLYSVDITTGIPTFLAGPFSLGADGEVIAYNYDDGFIYHWSGNAPALMETINTTTFAATPVPQSGVAHGEIFGAVYQGGGVFLATDISNRALTITSGGVVAVQQTGLPFDVRGLGYVDPLLPVELSSFTSTINRRDVTLNWTTVSEVNNSGFDIERRDSRSQTQDVWNKVGYVNGNGTSSTAHSYSFTDRGLNSGKYNYRLKQIDFNGNFEYFNLSNEVIIGVPSNFELSQNYPNPFNPSTKINYDLPFDSKVSIKLFDMSGKEVANLVSEVKTAGYYTVNFNASNLSSGVYFYKIIAEGNGNNFVATKRMALIK